MSNNKYGLLIKYDYCTGCHTCEVACKKVLNLPVGQHGIRVFQDGPREIVPDKWEYNFLPMPTSLCDLCEDRVAAGKVPSCVQHCSPGVMFFGPIDELAEKMKNIPKSVLYAPK